MPPDATSITVPRAPGLILLLALPFLATARVSAENLVPNPGFEELDAAGRPTGWSLSGPSAGLDDHVRHAGRRSLRLSHLSVPRFTLASRRLAVLPNTVYRISARVRTSDVRTLAGGLGACLYAELEEDRVGGYSPSVIGTGPWREVAFELATRPGTENLRLELFLHNASGAVWFDDMAIEPVRPVPRPLAGVPDEVRHIPGRAAIGVAVGGLIAILLALGLRATARAAGFALVLFIGVWTLSWILGDRWFSHPFALNYNEHSIHPVADSQIYDDLARSLKRGDGLTWADLPEPRWTRWAPLYPMFLAAIPGNGYGSILVAQSLLNAAGSTMIGLIGRALWGPVVGAAVGLITGCRPEVLARQVFSLMSESVAAFCVIAGVCLFHQAARAGRLAWLLLAGTAFGAAVLARPVAAAFLPAAWLALHLQIRGRAWLVAVATLVGGALLPVGPWILRNVRVTGAPVLSSLALDHLWANSHPDYHGWTPRMYRRLDGPMPGEREGDRATRILGEAMSNVWSDPAGFLAGAGRRAVIFLFDSPHERPWVIGLLASAYAAMLWALKSRSPTVLLMVAGFALTAVMNSLVGTSESRIRVPLEWIPLLCAASLVRPARTAPVIPWRAGRSLWLVAAGVTLAVLLGAVAASRPQAACRSIELHPLAGDRLDACFRHAGWPGPLAPIGFSDLLEASRRPFGNFEPWADRRPAAFTGRAMRLAHPGNFPSGDYMLAGYRPHSPVGRTEFWLEVASRTCTSHRKTILAVVPGSLPSSWEDRLVSASGILRWHNQLLVLHVLDLRELTAQGDPGRRLYPVPHTPAALRAALRPANDAPTGRDILWQVR